MQSNQSKPVARVDSDTRRTFIKKASTAAAVVAATNIFKTPVYGQNTAPSPGRVIGANDRIVTGHIGVGYGIDQAHFMSIQKFAGENNVAIGAGCELYSKRRDWMKGAAEQYGRKVENPLKDSDLYSDYRKLLERKDLDGVLIATHDPWHAKITIDA